MWGYECESLRVMELMNKGIDVEKRIDILENRAITDIEEESPKYYVVKRKLGPDKED